MRPLRSFVILALLGMPGPARAQGPLMLQPLQFELGLRTRRSYDPGSRTVATEEWIGLRLRGAVVDPRLVTFSFTARPRLLQNRLSGDFAPTGSNGHWLDLDLQLNALSARPLSATARLARFAFDERGYGLYPLETYARNLVADVGLRYENRLMPVQFTFRHERWGWRGANDDGVPGTPTTFQTVQLSGGNRKTSLSFQQTSNTNDTRLTLRVADIQNRQSWGKGSSSQLNASAVTQSSTGAPGTSNLFFGGAVHLQHRATISSDWSAQATSTGAGDFSSSGYALSGAVGWNVLPALRTGLAGLLTATDYSGGSEDQFRLGPNAGTSLRLPLGARLTASGAVAYQHYTANLPEGTEFVIVSERHVLDAAGSFLIDRADVNQGSLVVRSTAGVVYLPGTDYEVVETGGYTRVVALPGGRLQPGGTVLVDYRYRPITTPSGPALWAEYSGNLQIRWLQVYHRRWLLHPSAVLDPNSSSSPLRIQDQRATGARLAVPAGRLTLVAHGELHHRRDGAFQIDAASAGGSLNSRIVRALGMAIGAEYMHTEGTTGTNEEVGGRSQLEWMPYRTFQIGGTVMLWRSLERETIRRTRLDVGAQAVWQPGLLRLAIYYQYYRWRNLLLDSELDRVLPKHQLMLELARRF